MSLLETCSFRVLSRVVAKRNKCSCHLTVEADKSDNRKAIDRKLDQKLLLVVKKTVGDKFYWTVPSACWTEGQSMREVCSGCFTVQGGGCFLCFCDKLAGEMVERSNLVPNKTL